MRADPPLEHFALAAELGGQKILMDYYVLRGPDAGATLAARLPGDGEEVRKEVERLARSLAVRKPAGRR